MGRHAAKEAAQKARREQLSRLRGTRPLTPEERAEEALLERRLAGRLWAREQAETEARIARKLERGDA